MTDCWYCDKEVLGEYIDFHSKCLKEWHRRADNNLCVRCGKGFAETGDDYCNTCNDNSEYIDYPGDSV